MRSPRIQPAWRRRGRAAALAALAATLLAPAACAELTSLEQDAPSRVLERDLYTPANAQLLVTSAISNYECALANYIVAAGLVTDELIDAQLSAVGWDYDRRTITPALTAYATNGCGSTQVPGLYTPISVARASADAVLAALERWSDAEVASRQALIAQAAAYAGYALLLLGEGMCTAALDGGPELSRAQLFQEADARFTRAITAAQASNSIPMLNMARVGRARARLNLSRPADARTDAVLVPAGFVHNATYSQANFRRENLVHTQLYRGNFASIDPSFRGLTVNGVADPRVVVTDAGTLGMDRTTPIWRTAKYATIGAPIPIASWDEAQLIVAEAELAAGNVAAAVAAINALRGRAGVAAYAGGTAAEVRTTLIEERRRELFLEGHRLGDVIRYGVALTPAAGTPYPGKGGVYGSQVCFPLPDIERNNNPTISGGSA